MQSCKEGVCKPPKLCADRKTNVRFFTFSPLVSQVQPVHSIHARTASFFYILCIWGEKKKAGANSLTVQSNLSPVHPAAADADAPANCNIVLDGWVGWRVSVVCLEPYFFFYFQIQREQFLLAQMRRVKSGVDLLKQEAEAVASLECLSPGAIDRSVHLFGQLNARFIALSNLHFFLTYQFPCATRTASFSAQQTQERAAYNQPRTAVYHRCSAAGGTCQCCISSDRII